MSNAYLVVKEQGVRHGVTGRKPNIVPDGTKWCSWHQKPCPKDSFTGTERSCVDGKYAYHIRNKYGLTIEEFDNFRKAQNDVCGVCGGEWKYVDHNHYTGKVRGLLCPRCNTLVGFLETNPNSVELAKDYIARNE